MIILLSFIKTIILSFKVTLDFSDLKVLLIGDFMVDMYVYGSSTRMSPEAPVPVFIPKKSFFSQKIKKFWFRSRL